MGDTAFSFIILLTSYINIQDKCEDLESHYTKDYTEAVQKEVYPQSGVCSLISVWIFLTFAVPLPPCRHEEQSARPTLIS